MSDFQGAWIPMVIIGAIVGLLIFKDVQERREWRQFVNAHHCKVVAHIDGDTFNTFGTSASGNFTVGIGSTPDKTGWKCDDGTTYYHND